MRIGDELRKILPWLPTDRGCCGGKTLVQKLNEAASLPPDKESLTTQIFNEARKHAFRENLSRERCRKIVGILERRVKL